VITPEGNVGSRPLSSMHSTSGTDAQKDENAIDIDVWPWHGVILSAPAIEPDKNVATPFMVAVARISSSLLPKFAPQHLDSTAVSRIMSVVEMYQKDPLVYRGNMRARWAYEFLQAMNRIRSQIASVRFPFLVVHGTADRLVQASGSQFFCTNASSSDKTIKLYESAYHELFNDIGKEQVFTDMLRWLQHRLDVAVVQSTATAGYVTVVPSSLATGSSSTPS